MERVIALVLLIATLVSCSGEGNIHLMQDEIGDAIRSCSINMGASRYGHGTRYRRSVHNNDKYSRIDGNTKQEANQYDHARRNISERNQMHVLNGTDYDYTGFGAGDAGEKLIKTIPRPALSNKQPNSSSYNETRRYKRSDSFLAKYDSEQCLSQCVFANLEIVDNKGIPQEAQFWNKIQTSVNSQQSRSLLKDQLHACFQEMQSESEDNGCSYSNRLDRCLMLRLSDRQLSLIKNNQTILNKSKIVM